MSDENCIVDFAGSCWALGMPAASYWADWDPTNKIVRFGGLWHNVPDMPAETKPSEEDVIAWEEKHPSILSLRFAAAKRRHIQEGKRSDAIQKLFAKKIGNHCRIELINSKGSLVKYARYVGIMTWQQCLRSASSCIQTKGDRLYGYRIKSFKFVENITSKDIAQLPQVIDFKLRYAATH
jgi:hypothetical protein